MPDMPDSHSYIRTPTHRQPVTDYESVREKGKKVNKVYFNTPDLTFRETRPQKYGIKDHSRVHVSANTANTAPPSHFIVIQTKTLLI